MLSEAQPHHEDDLQDMPLEVPPPPVEPPHLDPAPPPQLLGLAQGPVRVAQHVAAAGVAMYVDDEVPGIGVDPGDEFQRAREREWDATLQAGALGEGLRNRGQRVR